MSLYEGEINGKGLRFCIVASRFNDFITARLVDGALDALKRHGTSDKDIDIVRVPGSFEIPMVVKRLAEKGRHDAVIALGTVIRGATPHFDYVAAEASKGIALATMETGVPVSFGVITSDTIEQAIERAGSKAGNKGWDAAVTAMEMANLMKKLS
ncbi:6,7-dimethyl-8-ribityllumazine synthase [bacterium BMS3Bbin06]|nr:6,7-dimethyl-8-ribityllumazine synthase [bacterium BMS3Abin08]GBE35293.1 6,7-dimethyl-8-ribityllumazine synthase [bacterium BMS3Bbin06]HDH01006.1 6,7-dimethyl-8-ribityllumazine synthase [Nitrospirota bacterium]HDO35959.1 6,7-dimethyl-8-ribityllumazine synthase [Nitrospirota bacterium]HDY70199.1 6,7-dimethyl-8-ribityllumazine synthase [Nitrospirota bacterium]